MLAPGVDGFTPTPETGTGPPDAFPLKRTLSDFPPADVGVNVMVKVQVEDAVKEEPQVELPRENCVPVWRAMEEIVRVAVPVF